MLGLAIELIISLVLIWFFERKNLSVLGLMPSRDRGTDVAFGIVSSAIISAMYYLSIGYISGGNWTVNEPFSMRSFFSGAWWTLKSVLFEELIFRGALLYILIRRFGLKAACFTSAICFGIYHWFSYNVLGDVSQMIFIFVMTGIAGLMFAFAFGISKSLYLPIGLHFGWNFTSAVIFSNGPLGKQLLILENAGQMSVISSISMTLFQLVVLPLIVAWYLRSRWKQQRLA